MSTIQDSLKLRLQRDNVVDDLTVIVVEGNIQTRLPILIQPTQIECNHSQQVQVASRTEPMGKIRHKITLTELKIPAAVFEQCLEHLVRPLVADTVSNIVKPFATYLNHIGKSRLQLERQASYQIILH